MVGQTRATHLCAHAHSEVGNLSVAVEWLSDFGRVATIGLVPLPVIGASLTAVKIQRFGTVGTVLKSNHDGRDSTDDNAEFAAGCRCQLYGSSPTPFGRK